MLTPDKDENKITLNIQDSGTPSDDVKISIPLEDPQIGKYAVAIYSTILNAKILDCQI